MKARFPLFAKILLWFFLNLLLLAVVFYIVGRSQFRFGLDSLVAGGAGERAQQVADVILSELDDRPRAEWDNVLKRFGTAYRLQFYLFRNEGSQLAGASVVLPAAVHARLTERAGFGGPPRDGPPEGLAREGRPERPASRPHPKLLLRSDDPTRYWLLVRSGVRESERGRPTPVSLITVSDSMSVGGLLFDFTPWLVAGGGAMLLSVLFWFPLVRGITRSIGQMTHATGQIAEGRFEVRVPEGRRDELGALGAAVNRMAGRLAGFVTGQKRFLGDIAHELCAPIARLQMSLGILEQRADQTMKPRLDDLREEVEHMSSLVNELLSFSKAGLRQHQIQLEPVNLAALARRVVAREALEEKSIDLRLDETCHALAEPELLARAVANLVRNSIRHAAQGGPITISAAAGGEHVTLTVADGGPGVPEETLQKIFDPFFRVDPSRDRQTGGVGLGLAIVKTCVEACQGTVTARNRPPSGLQVEIKLKAVAASAALAG